MAIRTPVLNAHELYRFFHVGDEETLALKGVSLTLHAGDFVAVQGPSGSGKTTLLNCLAGLDEPDGGHVEVGGQRMSRRPERTRAALRARQVGIMMQSANLFSHPTVGENLEIQLHLAGVTDGAGRLKETLKMLQIGHLLNARPASISGGEAARAGLAVALSCGPAVLLADEPTGQLDQETEKLVLEMLHGYPGERRAVLVVTHSEPVASSADRRIRLLDGRVINE
ncbi:ABC transporter ATP-binding protein [Salinispira pacifica]